MRSNVGRLWHRGLLVLGSLAVWVCCGACKSDAPSSSATPPGEASTTSSGHFSSSTSSSPTSGPTPGNPSPVNPPHGQPSATDAVVTTGEATAGDATAGDATSGDATTRAEGETSTADNAAQTNTAPDRPSHGETTKPNDETTTPAADPCTAPDLEWRSARKTNYESYPEPGSEECIEFNGCMWEGLFAACDDKMSERWVSEHNIVAAFPDFEALKLHDLCLRKGDKTIVVTVYDTCGDSDCEGCCTENKGGADQLIDLEKYTNERWGVPDGAIEWADLGPTAGPGCE